MNLALSLVLLISTSSCLGLSNRRTLSRFTLGNQDNSICWDRDNPEDGFMSVVDAHNHFIPFGGPGVPFDMYLDWMMEHGILFSTMFGIGQLLKKARASDPDCCYYLHCPTLDYRVVPDPTNDRINANNYNTLYRNNSTLTDAIHLTVSATCMNLQDTTLNTRFLDSLTNEFPGVFKWAGEINVFKHALAGNGFFENPRVTVDRIDNGDYDHFFRRMEVAQWPVNLHCDLGCDNYDYIPLVPPNKLRGCSVPNVELRRAGRDFQWWKDILGPFYPAFFNNATNSPNPVNFKKIQHLQVN